MSEERWSTGETIALRYFPRGELRWVKPVRVVDDSDDVIALFLAANTTIKKPVRIDDGLEIDRSLTYEQRYRLGWALGEATWRDNSVLMLTRPGSAHSYWAFWDDATWGLIAWYVNIQAPLARSPIGFDSEDYVLDLVIEPDLSSWRWKDEDELADAVRLGRFTDNDAERIRAEGATAIDALSSSSWPFACGWEKWRPDPAWTVPDLVQGWEEQARAEAR